MSKAREEEIEEFSQQVKVLGDVNRLRILALLRYGELCVCDIMAVLQLPQSTTSRHLTSLKNALWVKGTRRGKWMHYRLNDNFHNAVILSSLLKGLVELKQMKKDQRELTIYLNEKKKDACR